MKRGHGFTLLEVVVALAILGTGLMVILELFSGGLRLGRASEEYTKATQFAWMKIGEIELRPIAIDEVEEGEFDETYRWKVETKRVELLPFEKEIDFKPPIDLIHIRIHVTWKSGLKERSFVVESYRSLKLAEDEKKS